jgi:hypothetical protein
MESILGALKETPIPTILVVAGIVFLLLSIAGQLAGRIAVPAERQRWAAVMGGILLISGVALYVVPPARLIPPRPPDVLPATPPDPTPQQKPSPSIVADSPGTQMSPPAPEPTPDVPKTLDTFIPSLNARLTALRFFEGHPCYEPLLKERTYRHRFAKDITRDVFTELTLEYPQRDQRLDFTIRAVYQREAGQQGKVVSRPELKTYLPAESQKSLHSFRSSQGRRLTCPRGASGGGGKWSIGSYTVDVYIGGDLVTSGSFEIHE